MTARPWNQKSPIVFGAAHTTAPAVFVVEPGMSMPWVMRGPAVVYSTHSLADANAAAVKAAAEHLGPATASTWPEGH